MLHKTLARNFVCMPQISKKFGAGSCWCHMMLRANVPGKQLILQIQQCSMIATKETFMVMEQRAQQF
jgi:hypothetical protein